MRAYIEGIKLKEGTGVELTVIVPHPLMPSIRDYQMDDEEGVDSYNKERQKILHDIECFKVLHLSRVELTLEADQ